MRVLLVEDNQQLAQNVSDVLRHEHYEVSVCHSIAGAREIIEAGKVALSQVAATGALPDTFVSAILDLNLPDGHGQELIAELRELWPEIAILVLTAQISLESKVECLDAGADDYLTKPFAFKELLARLRAISRRHIVEEVHEDVPHLPRERIVGPQVGGNIILSRENEVVLVPSTKQVIKSGQVIAISPMQYRLLYYLCQARGVVKTATDIYAHVWGSDSSDLLFSDTLKVHISGLRKKLGQQIIQTANGFGYMVPILTDDKD